MCLLGRDIRIVGKEPAEGGTCFNINLKLPDADTEEEFPSIHSDCPLQTDFNLLHYFKSLHLNQMDIMCYYFL